MINATEKVLLRGLNNDKIMKDTKTIASFDRRSGREGEERATEYIVERLQKAGIQTTVHRYPVWLSDPVEAKLWEDNKPENLLPCKTWSFGGTSNGVLCASAVFMANDELLSNPLELMASRLNPKKQDLQGKIVVCRTTSPVAILDAQDRGAAAVICVWARGNEELIHEGNVNFIWGQPEPWEYGMYPKIPVVIMAHVAGESLLEKLKNNKIKLRLLTNVEEKIWTIPVTEAIIPGQSEEFILYGNHLDSWFYGACDNATGNAIALNLAELFAKKKLQRGIKICWWSGHSNGRYAGSSAYAAHNYAELNKHCIALCNSDMPGLQGAYDFGRCSSSPDLTTVYGTVISDITNQKLRKPEFITGWDLSFKNIGLSSCMSWSSTLPDMAPESTAGGFMSWWWHTEEDLMSHIDSAILAQDAQIYALSLYRIATEEQILQPYILGNFLLNKLKTFSNTEDLCALLAEKLQHKIKPENYLHWVRILNRALYTFKGDWEQDWAIGLDFVPGLSLAKEVRGVNDRQSLMLNNFSLIQCNRLYGLIQAL